MRILMLSNSYLPVLGGLQTVTHTLAQHMARRGHHVCAVTNRYPRSLPAWEFIDGVPISRFLFLRPEVGLLRRRRPDLLLASVYHWPATLARLARLVHALRPEVVNIHFPDAQIPFLLALRRHFAFRLVVSLHGHEVARCSPDVPATQWAGGTNASSDALRAVLREADAVTACSGHLLACATRLEPSVAGKGWAIHNGIDPDRFGDRTAHAHVRPYVLAVGRLTRDKGFDLLLDAFARVRALHPGVDVILAGDGEERVALRAQAERLDLAQSVHLLGRAAPEQVVRLLNGSLFVVVPSRRESFGIVALEALAAGRRVVATHVGGLPELLAAVGAARPAACGHERADGPHATPASAQAAVLVEPTVDGVEAGLRACLVPADDASVQACRKRVLAEFPWAQIAGRYESVMGGHRAWSNAS